MSHDRDALHERIAALEAELAAARATIATLQRARSDEADQTQRAMREAREARDRLAAVIASAPLILFAFDRHGVMTLQEGLGLAALGLLPGQRVGQSVFEAYAALPDSHATIARALAGQPARWEGRVGSRHLEIQLMPSLDDAGELSLVTGVAVDVTPHRIAREALEKSAVSEARFRCVIEQFNDTVVALLDAGGRTTYVSPAVERVLGVPPEATLGTSPFVWVAEAHREEARRALEQAIAHPDEPGTLELEVKRPDGSTRWIEVTGINRLHVPHLESIVLVYRDITEARASAEALAATSEQLRQAQKMEAIGSLAGGIAHDFNNLLTVIMSCTGLALSELNPVDPIRADLEEVARAATRASELTRQLLAFSRQQIITPVVVDPSEVIGSLQRMLPRLLGEHIRLSLMLDPRAGSIYVDPSQLEQILINLAVNARDAMPEGGLLTIETSPAHLDEHYARLHHGVTPGRYVMIAVSDTGVGMTAQTMARIFEPFFTTKEVGRGTGLGLSTVFGIVKQNGGHIWVYSEPDKGSTFKVYLPETPQRSATMPHIRPYPTTLRGHETILLVEDDDSVRQAMRAILQRQGYRILEANNGGEALLICEQFEDPIHLLVSDVIMPRLSGRQLAERLTALRPDLRVLFVSGYTENAIVAHGILEPGLHYLPKPVTPSSLALKVREVLDLGNERPPNSGLTFP